MQIKISLVGMRYSCSSRLTNFSSSPRLRIKSSLFPVLFSLWPFCMFKEQQPKGLEQSAIFICCIQIGSPLLENFWVNSWMLSWISHSERTSKRAMNGHSKCTVGKRWHVPFKRCCANDPFVSCSLPPCFSCGSRVRKSKLALKRRHVLSLLLYSGWAQKKSYCSSPTNWPLCNVSWKNTCQQRCFQSKSKQEQLQSGFGL